MKNFRFTKVLFVIVIILGGLYLLAPEYLRNVLIYQYANIDDYKLFDNRTVIAENTYPWEELSGFSNRGIPLAYSGDIDDYNTIAYLVIKDEKIIFEKYWEGYSSESKSNSFSISKSIVSLLVGIAIDKGYIHTVDQSISDFIPQFSHGDMANVSIRHLLEMSSGLSWTDSYFNPFGITSKAYYGDNLYDLALDQHVDQEPGKSFQYKNGNTQLLALILENATGMSISAFTSRELWKPMGASQDAYWSLDKVSGIEKAFCCFNSNARDFARFGQLILNNGYWNGKQLISQEYLNNALKPADHLIDKHGSEVDYFGWHWWIHEHEGLTVYSMRGLKGQYVFVIPEKNVVIVRLGRKWSKTMIDNVHPSDMQIWLDLGLEMAN